MYGIENTSPIQQLLTIVKTLTPGQKAKLRKELNESQLDVKP